MPATSAFVERAGRWFLESGIQEPDGGVARYYLASKQQNLPVSTEITGYAASTHAYLYRITGEAVYLETARRTAHFLTRAAWNTELETFPFELAAASPGYFFDCGIIVRGLLAVWRLTGEPELLEKAAACGRSMARDYLTPDGIHPVISLPERIPWPYEKRWSREPGCWQLKSAMAWRALAKATGEAEFLQHWERVLRMALDNHEQFLPGSEEPEKVMDRLHAYSYFMEALLSEAGRQECDSALGVAMGRTSRYLREIAPCFARSDVYGQLLRVRIYAAALGVSSLAESEAMEEADAIAGFQYESSDRRLDGGFCFGRKPAGLLPFANPVSTGFCVQALEMWRQFKHGAFSPDLEVLI